MLEIIIDTDVCKKDGLCAMACPRGILEARRKAHHPTDRCR